MVNVMKMLRSFVGLAVLAIASLSLAGEGPTLTVGTPAPPLKVLKWAKGDPVAKFEKGKVYVVEFWATWCGPCRQSIPHLTELNKKYAGKVTFCGIDAFERSNDEAVYVPQVEQFVKDFGDKMDYHVAIDGKEGTMANTWMVAAKQEGIPTAFVVDGTGTVAWIGHPMGGLDEALGKILSGSYDRKAAMAAQAKETAKEQQQQEEEAKEAVKLKPVLIAFQSKNFPNTVAAIEKVVASEPKFEVRLGVMKFLCLCQYDAPRAKLYAHKVMDGIYKDTPDNLNEMAWLMVGPEGRVKNPDLALALELAQAAVDRTKDDPQAKAAVLDTLAATYAKQGDYDKAIANEEAALKLVIAIPDFPADGKAQFQTTLDAYKKAKNP